MRRSLLALSAAALVGFVASDASACCHHKKAAVCEPAPVACEPAPVVCEAPVKKHCFHMPKFKMPHLGCHKKAACAPVYETCAAPAVEYAAPQSYAAPQAAPAAQSLSVPQK